MSAIFLCRQSALAQNWLELVTPADKLYYDEATGVDRLVGNLHFTYRNNIFYADSAHYKKSTKEVWAYGHIHINRADTLNLFCDSLYYNSVDRYAKLWGHVRIRDREYKITSDSIDYDMKRGQAIYRGGGRTENITSKEVLKSKFGYIFPDTEESFFSGNVEYHSPDKKMTTDTMRYDYLEHKVYFYGPTNLTITDSLEPTTKIYCERGWYNVQTEEGVLQHHAMIDQSPRVIHGDSIYYHPKEKLAIGRGNITVLDTTQKVEFNGGYFYSNEKLRKDLLTEKPWVRMMKSKDTLYLRADTLYHFRDTANKTERITGLHDVRFFQQKLQGKADSLHYDKAIGQMDMLGNPYFWNDNSELHGDSLRVFLKDDTLVERVHLRYNAFAASEVDSGNYYNQLAGKEIWAYFKDNEMKKAEALGNARTIFFPTDTVYTDTAVLVKRQGMNRMFAADLKVYLDSGEVVGITFLKQPDGIFFPMDKIDAKEQFLQGFSWNPALRPKRKEDITGEEVLPADTLGTASPLEGGSNPDNKEGTPNPPPVSPSRGGAETSPALKED